MDVNLEGASFYRANLVGANLEGANLEDADLTYADLEGANLTGTILEKKKTVSSPVSSVSATFGDELNAKIAEIESFLDKHGMKLASPISILPK
jgi:uncharacterized protein YjbI with pentapeptide repeats